MTDRASVVHGGVDPTELTRLGVDPADVLDFSSNVNPLGPPPGVRRVLAGIDLSAYPDPRSSALTQALAQRMGVDGEQVLVGNGSSELLHLLARAFLCRGDHALILTPTFGEYAHACDLAGARTVSFAAEERAGFRWDIDEACRVIQASRPRLVFLCNPNNPTGIYMDAQEVQRLAEATGSGMLIVDEAYREFLEQPADSRCLLEQGSVVLVRSMTKDYGLASLRLGYLVGAPEVVQAVRRQQPSWSVNGLAQAAGLEALRRPGHLSRARAVVGRSRRYLTRGLASMGFPVLPSAVNFLLVKVGDGAQMRRCLLEHGILVRDCASFGLPAYIRVGVRRLGDCRRLTMAMREVLNNG